MSGKQAFTFLESWQLTRDEIIQEFLLTQSMSSINFNYFSMRHKIEKKISVEMPGKYF